MAELAWRVASRAKGREEGIISTTGGGWRGLGVIAGWWEIPGGTVSPGHSVCYLPTGTPSPIINPWWLPFIMCAVICRKIILFVISKLPGKCLQMTKNIAG